MSAHVSFAQRIVVRCHLRGLRQDEVEAYLQHRLRLAGATVALFEPGAVEAVALASNGIPRRIDRIAQHALLAAAGDKAHSVDTQHVEAGCHKVGP